MLNKIKALADEAIALQNKNRMDEVLREISALCDVKEPAKKIGNKDAENAPIVDKPAKGAKNAK